MIGLRTGAPAASRILAIRVLWWLAPFIVVTTHAQEKPPVDELVRDLQAKYASVRDFSADFEHRYQGGVFRTSLVESGHVAIKKPGKMRWQYTSSEEKLYVSDGETFYSYFPLDRQVIVAPMTQADRASAAALFLAGEGDLAQDFSAAYEDEPSGIPRTWSLRLTPTVGEADYEWIVLYVDRATLSIVGLKTVDQQGGESTYRFTNLRENQRLPDDTFAFRIPDGVDVIDESGDRR